MIRIVVLAAVAVVALCAQASAAIYWGNSSTIGRVNNDGAFRQDGGGLGQVYIGALGENRIAGACGVAVNASHIYWGDKFHNAIGRANLDGSEANFAFIPGAQEPCGVAVDGVNVYWANEGSATIGRARLDGSEVRQDFIKVPKLSELDFEAPRLCGVAVNGVHLYWSNWREDLIGRATVAGQEVIPNLVETPEYGPCGVAVNNTHVFWGSYGKEIGRANLDGTEPDFDFIGGLARPCAVAVDATNLYWVTEFGRDIGRANLDGSSVTTGVVSGIQSSCGLAVNSLSFVPSPPPALTPRPAPPPPPRSLCKVEKVRHNRGERKAIVAVRGPVFVHLDVLTRGLRSRLLSEKAPKTANGNPRRWWVAVWPADEGRPAKRISRRLDRQGRATIDFQVRCSGRNELPTTATKELTLRGEPETSEPQRRHGER